MVKMKDPEPQPQPQPPPPNNLLAAEARLAELDARLAQNDEDIARIQGDIAALDDAVPAVPVPANAGNASAGNVRDEEVDWETFLIGFLAGLMFWLYFCVRERKIDNGIKDT